MTGGTPVVLLGALVVTLLSIAAYAALGRRADADASRKGAQLFMGAGDFFVHWFMWVLSPLERLSRRLGLGPDVYNFTGLVFGLASGLLLATGRLEMGGTAIALGGACDIMDGRLARALKLDSAYGKFIDSTLDRFVEVFALLGFAVYMQRIPYGSFLAAAALAGSLLVSYTRARGESLGVTCKEGLMQRGERLVLTCLVALFDPTLTRALGWRPGTVVAWTLGVIAIGTFGTAIHRTWWISVRLRGNGR